MLIQDFKPRFPCLWSQLTGIDTPKELSQSLAIKEKEVPLLLRDTATLLILIVSLLPLNVEKSYYSCICQVLYNLTLIQALVQITISRPDDDLEDQMSTSSTIFGLMKYVHFCFVKIDRDQYSPSISLMRQLSMRSKEAGMSEFDFEEAELDKLAKKLCLPFLRIAALLQSHLYNEPFPMNIVEEKPQEFEILSSFLGLRSDGIPSWIVENPYSLIQTWIFNYSLLFKENFIIAGVTIFKFTFTVKFANNEFLLAELTNKSPDRNIQAFFTSVTPKI